MILRLRHSASYYEKPRIDDLVNSGVSLATGDFRH